MLKTDLQINNISRGLEVVAFLSAFPLHLKQCNNMTNTFIIQIHVLCIVQTKTRCYTHSGDYALPHCPGTTGGSGLASMGHSRGHQQLETHRLHFNQFGA